MHHTIETLTKACQLAMSGANTPHHFVEIAGLGILLQRLDSQNPLLDTLTTFLSDKESAVADRVADKVVPMFMKIEDSKSLESRQESWNALYLYISALNFVSVSDSHRVHARIEQVLVGIDEDWSDLRTFASEIQSAYPIAIDDSTIDFVKATLGEGIQDEDQDEAQESEGDVLNLFVLQRLKGHIPVQYREESDDEDSESPMHLLDFTAQAASSPGVTLKQHFGFEHSKLFSVCKDFQPLRLIIKGDRSATATVDGTLISAHQEGDGVYWPFRNGIWTFVVDGESYTIEMKY